MKCYLNSDTVGSISLIFQPERLDPGYQKGKYFKTWSRWLYFKVSNMPEVIVRFPNGLSPMRGTSV